jgi:hypothetical protein
MLGTLLSTENAVINKADRSCLNGQDTIIERGKK